MAGFTIPIHHSNPRCFGSHMPGRNYTTSGVGEYRFGFNGKEKDDEVNGNGNTSAFEARIYNSRLGRFLSIDPIEEDFPWQSGYSFAANNPICLIDKLGMGADDPTKKQTITSGQTPSGIANGNKMSLKEFAIANKDKYSGKDFSEKELWKTSNWKFTVGSSVNVKNEQVAEQSGIEPLTPPKFAIVNKVISAQVKVKQQNYSGAVLMTANTTAVYVYGNDITVVGTLDDFVGSIVVAGMYLTAGCVGIYEAVKSPQYATVFIITTSYILLSGETADELIGPRLKKSPSYDPRYGGNTLNELEKLAKQGDKIAKGMKKLVKEGQRLQEKLKGAGRSGKGGRN